ncbi:MAG: N-acetylmuramoyl-L-alanine amidase [Bacteroidales bacterium]|nr:N-acetylmuramoyl-L-alanine amidase [Bacteroidales bacterium]
MKLRLSHIIAVISAVLLAIPVPAQDAAMRLKTVVIDPGHGGKDAGCVSRDQKTYEKNIALDIAKRLAQKISATYPDVNVKMTRSDDHFVELENRAVFANKAGADLFISVHVNAVDGSTAANGYSIHCLGQSKKKGNDLYSKNLDLVKRENSVIKLEKNYAATYQGFDPDDPSSSIIFSLMQNAHLGQSLEFAADVAQAMEGGPIKTNRGVSQDPFWVLWRTAMPAVLIEVGFMTNPQDLAVLRSEVGRDQIAQNIYKAFRIYKARYDREEIADQAGNEAPAAGNDAPAEPSVIPGSDRESPKPAEKIADEVGNDVKVLYGVQVLVTSKDMPDSDPFFAGYKPLRIPVGKLTKYVVGVSAKLQDVKKNYPAIQKKFPDSFIVKVQDGATSPVK